MNKTSGSHLSIIITVSLLFLLAACSGTSESQTSESSGGADATPAMADSVTITQRDNQWYATIVGNYPDPCTSISSVEQIVQGNTISITLLTDSPPDVVCAAVLTPFTIDILLTNGGLLSGEYNVVVNEAPSATFLLE